MRIFSRLHVISFVLAASMWSCSADPEVAKREYLKSGNDYVMSPPEEFSAFLRAEIAKWSSVVKEANVRVD